MKDCLLTGACGFIGSNLLRELIKKRQVYIYDNLSTGHLENIKEIDFDRNFEVTNISEIDRNFEVTNISEMFSATNNVDTIFHLGIPSSTPLYRNNRRLVGEAISDFIEVLEYCKEHNTKLVWASSSSIYNGHSPPHSEVLRPVFNTDFYTEARYYMERIAETYYNFYGVNSVGLRLFSVYGKNDWRKGKLANLITQAIIAKKSHKPFEVYGDGSQTRDFTYIKDIVRAFLMAERFKKDGARVFNVGTGRETTINKMVDLLGVNVNYVENPLMNYVERTCADMTLTNCIMGFKTEYTLKQGLKDYLKTENFKEMIR